MTDRRLRGLGPHLVGRRVVVRRVVRGETGPSGGPALTDLLGVMETWSEGSTTVRAESGEVSTIAIADIVSGKPVPPRPSVRHRVSAVEAELRAVDSWPPLILRQLGQWRLRASDGFSTRANSALAVGEPDMAFESAVVAVQEFYAERRLPPVAQVVVGSQAHDLFESARWAPARPGEADTAFQLASVASALRTGRRSMPVDTPVVSTRTTVSTAWLDADERPSRGDAAAIGVLEGPAEVIFVAVGAGQLVAKGRAACSGDWVGVTNLWVSPDQRRRGLAVVVMQALLAWAAQRGALTAYLQTRGDNLAALALYDHLGFVTHHRYRYLRPG